MLMKRTDIEASASLKVNKFKASKNADVEAEAQKVLRASLNKIQGKIDPNIFVDKEQEEAEKDDEDLVI